MSRALNSSAAGKHQRLHVVYARPIPLGCDVTFHASITHRGHSLAIAQVTNTNDAGKPCTIATVTAHSRLRSPGSVGCQKRSTDTTYLSGGREPDNQLGLETDVLVLDGPS